MRTSEIRSRWLDYFAANEHEIRPSVSLVSPEPSILFTVAGMGISIRDLVLIVGGVFALMLAVCAQAGLGVVGVGVLSAGEVMGAGLGVHAVAGVSFLLGLFYLVRALFEKETLDRAAVAEVLGTLAVSVAVILMRSAPTPKTCPTIRAGWRTALSSSRNGASPPVARSATARPSWGSSSASAAR